MRTKDYDYYYGDCPLELRPLSPWSYVGLTILYSIPVIGFIFLIIFTFHKGNLNRQSFTRSYWCALLVLILLIVGVGIFAFVTGKADDVAQFANGIINNYEQVTNGSSHPGIAVPANQSAAQKNITPEFKQLMDSYEAFIDEYVGFMSTYNASTATAEMIASYTSLMSRYTDFAARINAVDTNNLPEADMAYYLAVTARVEQKLLTTMSNMG